MSKRPFLIGLPILTVSLLLILIVLSYGPVRDITTAPKARVSPLSPLSNQLSVIQLPVTISYADLASYANEKIPQVLVNKRERKRYKTRLLGIPVEIKGRLTTKVKRIGPVRVNNRRGDLNIVVPLKFEAIFKGADTTDPDARSEGAVNVRLRLDPGMSPQWEPTLKARASYQWRRKPTLKVGLLRLDARKILGDALEEKLDELTSELENNLRDSKALRDNITRRWYEMHQVRQLGNGDGNAWLSVDPQRVYLSPLEFEEDALTLEFALAAHLTTLVGDVLPPPEAEPLPDLEISAPPTTGIHLKLPVVLDYEGITASLREKYLGQSINLEQGKVELQDFKLYSAGDSLVLGSQIQTESGTTLLNSQGWLYLQGKPQYDSDTRLLYMADFRFTRQVNNPLLSSISWVLQDGLRDRLAESLTYDLSERVAKAKSSLNERINRPIGDGLVMSGSIEDLGVAEIMPREKNLLILLDATGQIAISSSMAIPRQQSGENAD